MNANDLYQIITVTVLIILVISLCAYKIARAIVPPDDDDY